MCLLLFCCTCNVIFPHLRELNGAFSHSTLSYITSLLMPINCNTAFAISIHLILDLLFGKNTSKSKLTICFFHWSSSVWKYDETISTCFTYRYLQFYKNLGSNATSSLMWWYPLYKTSIITAFWSSLYAYHLLLWLPIPLNHAGIHSWCKLYYVCHLHLYDTAGIYLLKVDNRNTRTRCEIRSKLRIKTPEWCQCLYC